MEKSAKTAILLLVKKCVNMIKTILKKSTNDDMKSKSKNIKI